MPLGFSPRPLRNEKKKDCSFRAPALNREEAGRAASLKGRHVTKKKRGKHLVRHSRMGRLIARIARAGELHAARREKGAGEWPGAEGGRGRDRAID